MAQVTGRFPLLQGICSDDHSVRGAFHAPWRVEETGRNSPPGHEQPTPLWQAIIAGCRLLALRAASSDALMRLEGNFDGELFWEVRACAPPNSIPDVRSD
jgi:hypothetical protein